MWRYYAKKTKAIQNTKKTTKSHLKKENGEREREREGEREPVDEMSVDLFTLWTYQIVQ